MILDPNPPADDFPAPWAVAFGEDAFGLWQAFEIGGERQVMRWIAPGKFLMGSPEDEPERHDNETPHLVTISRGYWLAESATTQALWQAVMGENSARFVDDAQNPVEKVSWHDCRDFIDAINEQLGNGPRLRLPTEAEWEYACRAGSKGPFSWGDTLTTAQANYDGGYPYADGEKGEYRERTLPVIAFAPNAWGLYQMHGNVREWCNDWLSDYPMASVVDPAGPEVGQARVLRGGGWVSYGHCLRSADRCAYVPGHRDSFIGLRLAGGERPSSQQAAARHAWSGA